VEKMKQVGYFSTLLNTGGHRPNSNLVLQYFWSTNTHLQGYIISVKDEKVNIQNERRTKKG